ncbi:MAG: ribonuclease H-like domain-containing protein [Fuerstiella sp.]
MISTAWMHMKGLGPARVLMLQQLGVRSWQEAVDYPERVPDSLRFQILQECHACLDARKLKDISFFTERLHPADRHLILLEYGDKASYFDIETTGLEYDDRITVIACWHQGQLHTFVEGENLDDFLDLLDEIELLVSFNGSTFDVPRVLDTFHIPELPCPHLDLRWACHHRGLTGGLKHITGKLGLHRPSDLHDADGALAVELWQQWEQTSSEEARQLLLRYCAADVLLLQPLAEHIADKPMSDLNQLWQHLPAAVEQDYLSLSGSAPDSVSSSSDVRKQVLSAMFGPASPLKLRTRRRRSG